MSVYLTLSRTPKPPAGTSTTRAPTTRTLKRLNSMRCGRACIRLQLARNYGAPARLSIPGGRRRCEYALRPQAADRQRCRTAPGSHPQRARPHTGDTQPGTSASSAACDRRAGLRDARGVSGKHPIAVERGAVVIGISPESTKGGAAGTERAMQAAIAPGSTASWNPAYVRRPDPGRRMARCCSGLRKKRLRPRGARVPIRVVARSR